MPTDPFLPEGRQFPREMSPDTQGGPERKRRRKVLSCYDCRRRKLQCDRAQPVCTRCQKSGNANNCIYLDDAADAPVREPESLSLATPNSIAGRGSAFQTHPTKPGHASQQTGDLLSRLEFQDSRIKQLEAQLTQAGQTVKPARIPPTPESMAGGETTGVGVVQDRETTLLRGKSFKTQFHGNTHPGALIARIPELHGFTRETFESFPALSRIKEEVHNIENRINYAGGKHGVVDDQDLRSLLPAKPETDHLVEIYLSNYGSLYHIIHLPTFWEAYNSIWPDVANADPYQIALVLVMSAAAKCLTNAQPWLYIGNSSQAREEAVTFLQAVGDWLLNQSEKHVTAISFQIRVLLVFAKILIARKPKRTWTEIGSLMRFCMAAGLHRTPDFIRKPTPILDKELRKRVWAAVTELELQASFDRGMVSWPWAAQSDCPPPSHIHDDDMDDTTTHLPALRRPNDFCNVSYLALASESIILRQNLNNYLNNIRQPVHFDDCKRYTDEVEAHLNALPEWSAANAQVPSVLLSVSLRQYLLVLHDRQMRHAESKAERDFSRMVLVDQATKMLEAHKVLLSKNIHALSLFCSDQLRAALCLCAVAATNPHADDALSRAIDDTATNLIPEAINMLDNKVIRLGREQRLLWILLAANGYVKSKKDPSKRMYYMQEAVDNITRPYYKIAACQVDPPTAAPTTSSSPQTTRTPSKTGVVDYYQHQPPSSTYAAPATEQGPTDPALLDLDQMAAWTFEDWNFMSTDPLGAPNMPPMVGAFGTPADDGSSQQYSQPTYPRT